MPHQIDALEPETIEQVVVVENQVRKPVELLEIVGLLRAGMRRRIHAAMRREVVEDAVPLLPERTGKIDHRRAFALDDDRICREAARQLDVLRCLRIHAWTFASPLVDLTDGRAT